MSIISKLFGKKVVEKTVDKIAFSLKKKEQNAVNAQQPQHSGGMTIGATVPQYSAPEPEEKTIPGNSWGPTMPDEPNQFNYNGTWFEYFDGIFRGEFNTYRIVSDRPRNGYAVFTFYRGDDVALIVELLAQSSCVEKIRRDCRRAGIPYLRYYHNHEGWWNTRSYVTQRTRAALEM